jgi:hypothetical protein
MRKIAFVLILVVTTVVVGVGFSQARSANPPLSLLDALPDGTAVAVIDFQKVAGSSLWSAISSQDKFKSEIDKVQSEVADLGLKLTDVHTVALVFSGTAIKTPTVALTGGFEQTDLLARLRASGKVRLTSEKYKGNDIYTARALRAVEPAKTLSGARTAGGTETGTTGETSFVFYDANTVVTGSLDAVRTSVDVKTGAKPGLAQNSKLTDALAQNPAAAVRFAFALSSALTGELRSGDLPVDFSSISMIFGAIDVGSGIDVNATLRCDTAEHAKSISDSLNSLLAMARGLLGSTGDPKMAPVAELLKTVSIITADADVRITGQVPTELLNSLLSSAAKKGQ